MQQPCRTSLQHVSLDEPCPLFFSIALQCGAIIKSVEKYQNLLLFSCRKPTVNKAYHFWASAKMKNVKLPLTSQFLTDLILQRTGPFIKLGGIQALNEWFAKGDVTGLVQYLQSRNLVSEYLRMVVEECRADATALKNCIPRESLQKIVSIGPGNGLFELFLLDEGNTTDLMLIDIERTPGHYHGFNSKGSGYASLSATKKFIEDNVDASLKIHTCNPSMQHLPDFKFTLLVSILSMGFHYPCDEYVDFVLRNGTEGSLVVIDKRIGAPDSGFEKMAMSLLERRSIKARKSTRVFLQRAYKDCIS